VIRRKMPLIIVGIALAGCTSIKSTMLTRDEGNSTWTAIKTSGYPITVKVPTHLRLTVYEKFYITLNEGNVTYEDLRQQADELGQKIATDSAQDTIANRQKKKDLEAAAGTARRKHSPSTGAVHVPVVDINNRMLTTLDFTTQLIETEKIVTVDQKRPAAGTLKFKTGLTNDQSIQAIQSKAADDTIRQIGLAVQRFIANLNGGTVADTALTTVPDVPDFANLDPKAARPARNPISLTDGDVVGDDVQTQWRVVATKVFNLDDPNVELHTAEFLQATVNGWSCR